MIPDFDENGNLPPGIHRASPDEVARRFGQGSPERTVETEELGRFVEWCRQAGIKRLIVDGSYVTCKQSPNDVDVVILPGEEHPENGDEAQIQAINWPFLHIQIAL